MTQSALAGDCITRNMLSLIESGNASPSLHTLMQIARQLEVPVGYFFATDEAESSQFEKLSILPEIHNAFQKQDHRTCLRLCDTLPCPDQEIRFIRWNAHFALAEEALRLGALVTADAELTKAEEAADGCMYTPIGFPPTLDYLRHLIRSAGREEIPPALANPGLFTESLVPAEFFIYVRALLALSQNDAQLAATLCSAGLIYTPAYTDLISAKCRIAAGDTAPAIPILKRLLTEPLGFFTRYHVLTALEACAGIDEDFKSAYQYSAHKVHLLEDFSK